MIPLINDNFQDEKYFKTVIGLTESGILYVYDKNHKIGRYEYLTKEISSKEIANVLIKRKIDVIHVLKLNMIFVLCLLFFFTMRLGFDWGWKIYLLLPFGFLAPVVSIFTAKKTFIEFYGIKKYPWISHDKATENKQIELVENWCKNNGVSVESKINVCPTSR